MNGRIHRSVATHVERLGTNFSSPSVTVVPRVVTRDCPAGRLLGHVFEAGSLFCMLRTYPSFSRSRWHCWYQRGRYASICSSIDCRDAFITPAKRSVLLTADVLYKCTVVLHPHTYPCAVMYGSAESADHGRQL